MSPDIYSQHRRLRENRDVISKWKAIVNFPEIPVNHSVQTSSYPSWARVMEAEGDVAVVVVVVVAVSRLRCHAVTLLNVWGCSNFRWKCLLVCAAVSPASVRTQLSSGPRCYNFSWALPAAATWPLESWDQHCHRSELRQPDIPAPGEMKPCPCWEQMMIPATIPLATESRKLHIMCFILYSRA